MEQKQLDLIEKIIKNNHNFSNNEDLYEDFFNETCKRSVGVIEFINSQQVLESYLSKVATTSILNVLKDLGRLRRSGKGFVPTHEVSLDNLYEKSVISYDNFELDNFPEEILVKNDTLRQIVKTVCDIDNKEPQKQYLQIFKLRYDNGMTQKEISEEMGLSQSEISKRLFSLMEKVRQSFR